MSKVGLIPVQRTVIRNGKSFLTTVYIKSKHENKVDHTKNIQIPSWSFSTGVDLKTELDRINSLSDRSERHIMKEHLMEHIENNMKVTWDKVPDNEERAFVRNNMRAFSAAKKHLLANPVVVATPKPQAQAQPKQVTVVAKQPGSSFIMDRDTSKKLARDFRDKNGMDKVVPMLKSAGITWDEVPEVGPNNMRALRALASFIRKGGELGDGQIKVQPQLVINNPNAPLNEPPKSKYEKGTIQHDYELAKSRHKYIGLATGVMPVDDQTADYLETLIKEGKFGFLSMGAGQDYGIPAKMDNFIDRRIVTPLKDGDYDGFSRSITSWSVDKDYIRALFRGTPYESEYKQYVSNFKEFNEKYRSVFSYSDGVGGVEHSTNYMKALGEVEKDWAAKTGEQLLESLADKLKDATSLNESSVNELWDKFGLDDSLSQGQHNGKAPIIDLLIETGSSSHSSNQMIRGATNRMTNGKTNNPADIKVGIANGTMNKQNYLFWLGEEIKNSVNMRGTSDKVLDNIAGNWRLDNVRFARNYVSSEHSHYNRFNEEEFFKKGNEILSDLAPLSTPEAEHVAINIAIRDNLQDFHVSNRNIALPKYTPLSKEDWEDSRNVENTIKVHIGSLRKKTDKAKEKYIQQFKADKTIIDYAEAMKKGVSHDKLTYPDADDIKDIVKTTLMAAPESEVKSVTSKIEATHDKSNHNSFKTVIHGVYRVKRIASEEKFQAINDDINNTGFYYHGTSFDTAQKILGQSGTFKVFGAKDRGNIKSGSMLGYGIYLASQSSKSMQYVGNGFRSGSRGVLMLCKASLGNAVHTTDRGSQYNQPIMARATTDSVWMDKPHVINPEWAVKRAEQAVPRLWIDAERVSR